MRNIDVIVTNEYIHCSECKKKLIKVSELEQKIDDDCDFYEDGEYELFCDICEKEKLVDIGIEFTKQVYIKEDNSLYLSYKYKTNRGVTIFFMDYLYEEIPIIAPFFNRKELKEESFAKDIIYLGNLEKVNIKNEGKEHCQIILKKGTKNETKTNS